MKLHQDKGYKLVLPDGLEMDNGGFYRIDFPINFIFLVERYMVDHDLLSCECGECGDDIYPSCFDSSVDNMMNIAENYRKKTGISVFDMIVERVKIEEDNIGDMYYLYNNSQSVGEIVSVPNDFPLHVELEHPVSNDDEGVIDIKCDLTDFVVV